MLYANIMAFRNKNQKNNKPSEWSVGYAAGDINFSQPGDLGWYYSSSGLGSINEADAKGSVVLTGLCPDALPS